MNFYRSFCFNHLTKNKGVKKFRLKADIRISIKNNVTGKSHKIELIKFPNNSRRFWLRSDKVNSKKKPEITVIQLGNRLRKLLKMMACEL
jgi:hypothetical protein